MFDRARVGVWEDEAAALNILLIKYIYIFAEHGMDLRYFSAVKHVIDTKDAHPVKQTPRRTPLAFEGEEKKKNTLFFLDAGIISRGVSEWATPTVLVRNRDGTVRYCIDLRKVNAITVKDRYILPKKSECIDALAGCDISLVWIWLMGITRSRWRGRTRKRLHL